MSIPLNIAEGAARTSKKEFLCFLSNAQGSASEVETELLIAYRLSMLGELEFKELSVKLNEIGRMLSGLMSHTKSKI